MARDAQRAHRLDSSPAKNDGARSRTIASPITANCAHALENVHSFRYEDERRLEAAAAPKPVSVPRTGNNTQTLHGTAGADQIAVDRAARQNRLVLHSLARAQVRRRDEEPASSRSKCRCLANTIARIFATPRAEDPAALAEVMEKVPGYRAGRARSWSISWSTRRKKRDGGQHEPAADVLETLGLERARNLALTFFALNYEFSPKSAHFDWTPLWRHQISVGVVHRFHLRRARPEAQRARVRRGLCSTTSAN